jgi:hypothetical protein
MNKKQKDILDFIAIIRRSFSDASIIYQYWWCYGFYQIIKHIYPDIVPYLCNDAHVVCRLWDFYYDIDGILEEWDNEFKEMTELDHYRASSWWDGQRVENMIKKYNNK